MILVTGATGSVGRRLVERLVLAGRPVRCLVRDPRRLGAQRVHVQLALGDLASSFPLRAALRGVDTVVHLASPARDERPGWIEQINAVGTFALVRAAERAGVGRILFLSALGASHHARARYLRAKALGEEIVASSTVGTTTVALSLVVAPPPHPFLPRLERTAALPLVPVPDSHGARFQPIAAEDVAAALEVLVAGPAADRVELAGPDTVTLEDIVRIGLRAIGRPRRLLPVPGRVMRPTLAALGRLAPDAAYLTGDEVELLRTSMLSAGGPAGAEALGVVPRPLGDVLRLPGR